MRFALIAEGPADAPLVDVVRRLCHRRGFDDVRGGFANEGLEVYGVGRSIARRVDKLLEIEPDYDFLCIHMDGDNEGLDLRRQRIDEAIRRCQSSQRFRRVRIVPVRMTESWLLVDEQALRTVCGYPQGTQSLGLPKRGEVEDLGRKQVKIRLREALIKARRPSKRGRKPVVTLSEREYANLRSQLFEELDLDGPINDLPSWRAFVTDLESVLPPASTQPA